MANTRKIPKKKLPFLTDLVVRNARKMGARVIVEPKWGYAGQIIFKNKAVRSLRFYSLDLNQVASSEIARDKDFAKFFLAHHGYSVAKGESVFEESWAKEIKSEKNIEFAKKFANKIGYPLIVKPNSKSQGTGVFKVKNENELVRSLKEIFKIDRVALIEEYRPGKDYRIVVLEGSVVAAYERIPLSVLGDGKKTILELISEKEKKHLRAKREVKFSSEDRRIREKLREQKLNMQTVLPKGVVVFLLDNANLSAGGEALDKTDTIHSSFKKFAIKLSKDMGLRMSGVDIMLEKGEITEDIKSTKNYVIEINATPGLDHYASLGSEQKRRVEEIYLKILRNLEKNN